MPGLDPTVTVTAVPLKIVAESISAPVEVWELRAVTKVSEEDVACWGDNSPRTSMVMRTEGLVKGMNPLTTIEFPVSTQGTALPVTGLSPPTTHMLQVPGLLQPTSNVIDIVPSAGMP